MKFVIDENVSYGLAEVLRGLGYEVITVAELANRGMKDVFIFDMSEKEGAILVTRDYHFTNPFWFAPEKIGGIFYIHHGNLKSEEEIRIVTRFLKNYHSSQFEKRLVTLYKDSAKIREKMSDFE